jgi:hypothetical protein
MDGVDTDAHGGDLEVTADPGQRSESFFLRDLFRRERAAYVGGVDRAFSETPQVHLVVTRSPHDTLQVADGVQTVIAQDNPSETTRRRVGGVDS